MKQVYLPEDENINELDLHISFGDKTLVSKLSCMKEEVNHFYTK